MIILVFLPIVLPVMEKLQLGFGKLDLLIWVGALTAVNMQTAYPPTELLTPPIIRHLAHADLADCVHHVLALRDRTSTCRSFATISSGLYRFLAIAVLLDVKDIPQVEPLQWGRIITTGTSDVYPNFLVGTKIARTVQSNSSANRTSQRGVV